MANHYEDAATLIPAEAMAPGAAKRIQQIFLEMEEQGMSTQDWSGGLLVEAQPDDSLYISSADDWFNYDAFCAVITAAAAQSLILKSFGIGTAWYCSKLRPDEFGGAYHRVLPSGEVLSVTSCLAHRTDEEVRAISSAVGAHF